MLLNISEMEDNLTIKLGLEIQKTELFVKKLQEFMTMLENSIEIVEGVDILEILSFLISFKEYFKSKLEWENLVTRSMEVLCQDLSSSIYQSFYAYSGLSHVAFILHQLYEKVPNIGRLLNNVNDMLTVSLYEYIEASDFPEFYTMSNFELLYGLSGPLRYALDFNNDEKLHNMALKIVEMLVERSHNKTINNHTVPGWHYYPSKIELDHMYESTENGVINYGVAHGMGGPLMTLSLAYSKGIRIDGLREAIDGIFTYYFNAAYYANDIVYWPGRITFQQYIGKDEIKKIPRQMSWCYGSAGILRTMYLAAIYMSNETNKIYAENELIKIAKMDIGDYMLSLPIVCHGYAGVASLMNEMYTDTKNEVFLEMTKKLLKICIDNIINANYSHIETDINKKVLLYCNLEGYSSIFQTIQSFIVNGDNLFKKRILVI